LAEIFAWLVLLCESLALDGLFFRPSHYHLAYLARRHATFLYPQHAAIFAALQELLVGKSLAEASHLVHSGQVLDKASGQPLVWEAFPMVLPVSAHLKELVSGPSYQAAYAQTLASLNLALAPQSST
jgi:hypothetical protein